MIEMSVFNDYFKSQIEYRNDFGMVMRYNNARVDKRIKTFVFVEGSTDKRFYINTNIPELSNNAAFFYKVLSDRRDEFVGKESVFYSYKVITSDEKLREDFDKCIFIVDRDYSDRLYSHNIQMGKEDYTKFHVTKGHSFEDYFVDGMNIDEVFLYYHLGDEAIQKFKSLFMDFFIGTYEYFALCGATAEVYDSVEIKYRYRHRQADIIKMDFENGILFDQEKLNEEKRRMRAYLRENRKEQLYKGIVKKVAESPIFLRGHNVFEFLQNYLMYYHNISFNDKDGYYDYKRIVKRLKVEIQMYSE